MQCGIEGLKSRNLKSVESKEQIATIRISWFHNPTNPFLTKNKLGIALKSLSRPAHFTYYVSKQNPSISVYGTWLWNLELVSKSNKSKSSWNRNPTYSHTSKSKRCLSTTSPYSHVHGFVHFTGSLCIKLFFFTN